MSCLSVVSLHLTGDDDDDNDDGGIEPKWENEKKRGTMTEVEASVSSSISGCEWTRHLTQVVFLLSRG